MACRSINAASASPTDPMRCIALIDMDCFYAQVEAVRLGVDCRVTPLVLAQWGSLIAVNYPARARGVRRFHNVTEARALCPELLVALSPSYRVGEAVSEYHPHPTQDSYKISLEPYRRASRQIFAILASTPGVLVEKGSVDEAYVDVTEAARWELAEVRAAAAGAPLDALADVLEPSTRLIEDRRAEMEAWLGERGASLAAVFDGPMRALQRGECGAGLEGSRAFCVGAGAAAYGERCLLLCAASRVVRRLRQRIYAELHYDCSAGIAHNRVLAKCISATHKPNQQTLLLPDRSASALFELPLSALRGFGGKFGAAVSAVCGGATECREVWLVPLAQLRRLDGTCGASDEEDDGDGEETTRRRAHTRKRQRDAGALLDGSRAVDGGGSGAAVPASVLAYLSVRGLAKDTISNRPVSKTLIASKNLGWRTTSVEELRRWVVVLAAELCSRYDEFVCLYHVRGRSLNVKLGNDGFWSMAGLANRTVALPAAVQPAILAAAAMREVCAVLSSSPGSSADSVTLTIGGFVSDGSGAAASVPSLAAVESAGAAGGVMARRQMLLSSFAVAPAAGVVRQADTEGVVEVVSSSSSSSDLVDDGAVLSLSSRCLSSTGGDGAGSSVVLVDGTPPSPMPRTASRTREAGALAETPVRFCSRERTSGELFTTEPPPSPPSHTLICSSVPDGEASDSPNRRACRHRVVAPPLIAAPAPPPPCRATVVGAMQVAEDRDCDADEGGVTIID
ncbi:DNA polymerase eta [Novymonas esmeraldas]|uniref:DNA polymerase eta n=1 Tax=Novymonas esmeraldas TaxID=1808958 RepID=A0AAW0F3J1_9TRYP